MNSAIDLYIVYEFIKKLSSPFEKWEAYEKGVIDKEGNILKSSKERPRGSLTKFDLLVLKIKKLLEKVPGGNTRLGTYAAALWLIKENQNLDRDVLSEEKFNDYLNHVCENMSVGSGSVDGIGIGEKGEPGFTLNMMKKYTKKGPKKRDRRNKEQITQIHK